MKLLERISYRRWLFLAMLLSFCFDAAAQERGDEAVPEKLKPLVSADSKKNWHRFISDVTLDAAEPEKFFEKYREAFGLLEGYGMTLTKQSEEAKLGMHHYRFQQTFNGIPIAGAEYILHQRDKQSLKGNGTIISGFSKNEKPGISGEEALANALKQVSAKLYAWEDPAMEKIIKNQKGEKATFYPQPRLVYYSPSEDRDNPSFYQLVYELKVFALSPEESHQLFYINATDGSVIQSINLLHDTNTPASGTTKYNGAQNFTTDFNGANYTLRETNRAGTGTPITTLDMNNSTDYGMAVDFQNNSTSWQNEPVGVQGHWALEKAFDYHLNVNGRNSFDDAGGPILAYLDYGSAYNNASWNGVFMKFGSGDGVSRTSWTAIDVVGHELTHGVTEFSAGLIYLNESGALNESFSDIFGTMIEFYAQGNGDWLISEDVTTNGLGIRSMSNPNAHSKPDTYRGSFWEFTSNDNGGVHTNSGVQNFWFYLLSEGGSGTNDKGQSYSVTGIGRDAAAAIAYRNLIQYLMPTSRYVDAREGALEAAEDLYGRTSNEYAQTARAWHAVGLGFPVYAGQDLSLRTIYAAGASCNQLLLKIVNQSTIATIPAGTVLSIVVKENGVFKPAEQVTLPIDLVPGGITVITLSQSVLSTSGKVDIEVRVDYAPDPEPGNNIVTTKLLRGIMTIGGTNPDFTTVDAALTAVKNPDFIICGNLDFKIRSGTYSGEWRFEYLPSTGNTITFESETGNASDVTLRSNITINSAYGAVNIERSNGIRLKNMTIVRQAANSSVTTAIGIAVRGDAHDLILEGLTIRCLGTTGPYRSNIEFQAFGEDQSDIIVRNCLLEQSNNGIVHQYGPHTNDNVVIEGNRFNGHQVPLSLRGNGFLIRNNKITSTVVNNNGSNNAVGVTVNITGEFRFEGNELNITNPNTISFFGVNVSNASYVKMRNNIINMRGPTAMTGAFANFVPIMELYHNTIRLEKSGSGTGQVTAAELGQNVISAAIWNNIMVSAVNGAVGIKLRNQDILSNGNCLRFPSGFVGLRNGTTFATLQLWRNATGLDINSNSIQPPFVSTSDAHLSSQSLSMLSPITTIVKNDIDGELRNSNTPTMGADEFYAAGDLGITAVRLIDQGPACDQKTVQVDIKNLSVNTPFGIGMQIPLTHTVNGINAVSETITLTANFLAGQTITYTFTQRPEFSAIGKSVVTVTINRADPNAANNTSTLNVVTNGVYTVGGTNPDFATVKHGIDFITAATLPCVVPLITFKIRPGIYADPISISELPGIALSLESENGIKTEVFMVASTAATVSLLGAKHVTFKDLTLEYSGSTLTDGAMLVKNACEDITITNCNITTSALAAEHYAIKSGPTLSPQLNGFQLTNCVFTNGGIRMESNASGSYPFDNITITGNTFTNAITHSVYLARTGLVTVSDNTITSSNVSSGISLTQPLKDVRVERNRISLDAGVNGIYFFNLVPSFSKIYVINNFVNVKSGGNAIAGITIDGKGGYIYHNTVRLSPGTVPLPTGLVAAFYVHNSGLAVRNNIFSSTITNAVGVDWLSGPSNEDYNDIYIPNGNTGKQGTQLYSTLADWRTAMNLDLQSTAAEPLFVSVSDLHLAINQATTLHGVSVFPAVLTDIDGEPRSFPFIGADEYIFPPSAPTGLTATGGFESVTLTWNPNYEANVVSYNVYGASTGQPLVLIATVSAPDTSYIHTSLIGGQYTYQLSAVDDGDRESEKSDSVTAEVISLPTITSFVPASGPIGTSVTLNGSGFNGITTGNIIYFGATRAEVALASPTQLVVMVPAGATYEPITVLNTTTILTGYSAKPFIVTGGSGAGQAFSTSSFDPRVDFASGSLPFAVTSGDLDGDGKPDMVVANSSSATISVYRNTTSPGSITAASFAAKVDFVTDPNPAEITIGDIDKDGKPDIVVTTTSGAISIYRNTSSPGSIASSSFASRVNFSASGIPRNVVIRDFDGDGKPDLSVVRETGVVVLRNTSTPGAITAASLAAPVTFFIGGSAFRFTVGDLDGDDKPDLVASSYTGGVLAIMRNTAVPGVINSSSFATHVDFPVGINPYSVAIGDLDGDGKPDLAVGNRGSHTISVLRNTTVPGAINSSSFTAKVDFATGTDPNTIAMADMNSDGKSELIAGNSTSQTISILRNVISGGTIDATSFAARVDLPALQTVGLAVSDLDGDGRPDMAAANYSTGFTVSVYHNAVDVIPPAVPTGLTAEPGYQSVTLNWNANTEGDLDSYKVYGGPAGFPLLLLATVLAPETTFTHTGLVNGQQYAYQISAVDELGNESARTAIVTAIIAPPVITSFVPASGPVGTLVTISGNNFNSTSVNNNIVYFGATRATVATASQTQLEVIVPAGATYQFLSVLNSTTTLTGYSAKPFIVTGGTGTGQAFTASSFASRVDFTTGPFPYSVACGDLDGDGKPELAVANYNALTTTASISIYRNTTSIGSITAASFAARVDFDSDLKPNGIVIGDLDKDGKPDLAVSCQGGLISVFHNTSTPGIITTSSFAARVNFTLGLTTRHLTLGDLDGDGKPELAAACQSSVAVLRNTSTPGSLTTASFAAPVFFTTGATSYAVAIGDLDGDDKPDMVTANSSGGSISVFRNTSVPNVITTSSFAPKVDFTVGTTPQSVSITDLNGDAKPDLAVGNRFSNTISVFPNTATQGIINATSFGAKVDFATGTDPYSVKMADMNGDGKSELIVGNSSNQTVGVLRNVVSAGVIDVNSFAAHVDFPGSQSVCIEVGDLDGDGKPDMAVVNYSSYTVSVFRNNTPPPSGGARHSVPDQDDAAQSAEESNDGITSYPNPTTGKLYITLPNAAKASIAVMDVTGHVHQQITSHTQQVALDLEHVSRGVHIIKVNQENREKYLRVVVE